MKTIKKDSGISVISIVFYVIAVIFLGIAVYGIYQGYMSVENYKLQYTMTFLDIIGIYFSACAQYFAYAFILYGIGTVLSRLSVMYNALYECMDDTTDNKQTDMVEEAPTATIVNETSEA